MNKHCDHIVGYWEEQKDCFPVMLTASSDDVKYYFNSIDVKFNFCPECGEKLNA